MTDDGIIIQLRTHRDFDQIVTFYFRRHGKMNVVARGAKRSRRRFIGLIGKFNHLDCELKKNKNSSLMELQEASLINACMTNAKTFESLIYGSYLLDLVLHFSKENQASSELFDITLASINGIAKNKNAENIIRRFEWDILTITGYKPELNNCIRCRKERNNNQNALFYTREGGIVCQGCKSRFQNGHPISADTIKLLQNREDINSTKAKSELKKILPEFIEFQLGRKIPSLAIVEETIGHPEVPTLLQSKVFQSETMG